MFDDLLPSDDVEATLIFGVRGVVLAVLPVSVAVSALVLVVSGDLLCSLRRIPPTGVLVCTPLPYV